MTRKNMRHASKISNRNFVIFGMIFILTIGIVASSFSYANAMAFAQVEDFSTEALLNDVEVPTIDAPEAEVPAVEVDPNETCSVTIASLGEGKIETTSELTLEVPSGTVYKVNGNELYIGDKSYLAVVTRDYYFKGWYLNEKFMQVYGVITSDSTIVAQFSSDATSCKISGQVLFPDFRQPQTKLFWYFPKTC